MNYEAFYKGMNKRAAQISPPAYIHEVAHVTPSANAPMNVQYFRNANEADAVKRQLQAPPTTAPAAGDNSKPAAAGSSTKMTGAFLFPVVPRPLPRPKPQPWESRWA